MIASIATAVLPVWRSPMINSRWPRPIGTIPSMALMPVCSGSLTGERSTTPGAMRSMGIDCLVAIGPLPSMGWPSALTTRPIISSPTGTEMMRPVRLTVSPSLRSVEWPRSTAPTLSSSRLSAMPNSPWANSSISPAMARSIAVDARDAVTHRDHGAHFGHVHIDGVVANVVADDFGNLFGLDLHQFLVRGRSRTSSGGAAGRLPQSLSSGCRLRRRPAISLASVRAGGSRCRRTPRCPPSRPIRR